MKRRISLLLVFLLGLSLVACGGTSTKIPKTPDATDEVKLVEDYLEILKTAELTEDDFATIRDFHASAAHSGLEETFAEIRHEPIAQTLFAAYLGGLQWRYLTTETLPNDIQRVVFEMRVPQGELVGKMFEMDAELFNLETKLQDTDFAARYATFVDRFMATLSSVLVRMPFDVTETDDGLKFAEPIFLDVLERGMDGETYVLESGEDANFEFIWEPNFKEATDPAAWDKLWDNEDPIERAKKLDINAPVKEARDDFDEFLEGMKTFERDALVRMFPAEEADQVLAAMALQPEILEIIKMFLQYIHFDFVTGFDYDDDAVRLVYVVRAPREEIMEDMARDLDPVASQMTELDEIMELVGNWFDENVDAYYETYPMSFPARHEADGWNYDIEDMPGF